MSDETVAFKFPKKLVRRAMIDERFSFDEIAKDPAYYEKYRLESLLYVQVLEWQKKQKHVVTADTPAGADVIYTNSNGEEHPAVLVAHRRGREALVWIRSDPSNYLLTLIKLEDLRLAEGGGQ